MELLLIVQSIALLVLTVSNLLTVITLQKLREDIRFSNHSTNTQLSAMRIHFGVIKQRINNVKTLIPRKQEIAEEVIGKLHEEQEAQGPKYVFNGLAAETQSELDKIAAFNDPKRKTYAPDAQFVMEMKTPQRYILNATGPELTGEEIAKKLETQDYWKKLSEVSQKKKSLEENVVVDEHAQKVREAEAVIQEHAEEQKIELAQKLKKASRQRQVAEKKKTQDHTDLREE